MSHRHSTYISGIKNLGLLQIALFTSPAAVGSRPYWLAAERDRRELAEKAAPAHRGGNMFRPKFSIRSYSCGTQDHQPWHDMTYHDISWYSNYGNFVANIYDYVLLRICWLIDSIASCAALISYRAFLGMWPKCPIPHVSTSIYHNWAILSYLMEDPLKDNKGIQIGRWDMKKKYQ